MIPGYHGNDQSVDTLVREAERIGYPVLLKASAGGGGKGTALFRFHDILRLLLLSPFSMSGMRIVYNTKDLPDAVNSARREAKDSFGSDKLLVEKYFSSVRHVEIQIFGDAASHVIHLFERDCSVQRRHQKVIEESPSPAFIKQGVRLSPFLLMMSFFCLVIFNLSYLIGRWRHDPRAHGSRCGDHWRGDPLYVRFRFLHICFVSF